MPVPESFWREIADADLEQRARKPAWEDVRFT